MIINISEYDPQLRKLWKDVFEDDDEYISIFFDFGYKPCECFAVVEDGEVLSAFYLMGCRINFEGEVYKGRYLYAAATHKDHRGKGYMSSLIKEAQEYCRKENIDFISLVPSNDELYDYYASLGFVEAMHKYLFETKEETNKLFFDEYILKTDEVHELRKLYKGNCFIFGKMDFRYAFYCIRKSMFAQKNSRDSLYLIDKKQPIIEEYISSEENFEENTRLFFSKLKKGTKVYSPYDFSQYGESECIRFGMLYPVNQKLIREWSFKDIYMNLALD